MNTERISWNYPDVRKGLAGQWDKFVGPGANTAETLLSLVPSIIAVIALLFYAHSANLGWNFWQYLVATIIVFDFTGGVTTNATTSAKRWYHRDGQGFKQLYGFVAIHAVQIFLVSWLFRRMDLVYFFAVYFYLLFSAFIVLKVSLRIQRSFALLFTVGSLVLSLYILSPTPGFEWFIPVLFLKLMVSHLTKEEPYV